MKIHMFHRWVVAIQPMMKNKNFGFAIYQFSQLRGF
jgi:hypothetical protein